jgi:hypothetical protein
MTMSSNKECPQCGEKMSMAIDEFAFQAMSLQPDGSFEPHGEAKKWHFECECGYDSRKGDMLV